MKATDQTIQQIERAIRKIADKYPVIEDHSQLTDIHIRVIQETGELLAFDEDPKTAEIMTKVITFAQDDKIKDPYIMQQITG